MSSNGRVPHEGLASGESGESDPASTTPKPDPAARVVDNSNATTNDSEHEIVSGFKPDWRFWLIYISLCLVTFASAVDNVSWPSLFTHCVPGDHHTHWRCHTE